MATAHSNGIEIEYVTFGNLDDPAMLLIMGLGAQLVLWDEEFCQQLAARGFWVIIFDHRDVGLSTKIDGPVPDFPAVLGGDRSSVAYTLGDMADDSAGLLSALDIDSAHLVGVSMGGMIAQCLAIRHPYRVRSLCSIMSTTGAPAVGQPSIEVASMMMMPLPSTRDEAIEREVEFNRLTGSPGFDRDEDAIRERAARSWDRCHYPEGMFRQVGAVMAASDRTDALSRLHVPTVVIHGEADSLIDPSGGRATAAAIPGATLVMIPGMGHEMPSGTWPQVLDAIVANTARSRLLG